MGLYDKTVNNLELLKAEIEWDKSIEYQVDLDTAINVLKSFGGSQPVIRVNGSYYKCPSCGKRLRSRNANGCYFKNMPNYCEKCGTGLIWNTSGN